MSKCDQCIVRQLNSLKELSKDELIRISECKTSTLIKRGDVLFDEGEHINGVFCIRDGVCKVSKMSANGKDQIIKLIKKGDLIGERSLISNETSNLKAVALNDMEVCFIPKEEIMKDLRQNSNFTMSILNDLAAALKQSDNVVVDMAQKTVKQRLAETLLHLNKNFDTKENGALDIQLSREDLANIIGTATESAIRLLSGFKKEKLIDLKGKEIFILDIVKLKNLSEGF
ncbi:Crp/Fnr family transcriptional regulator [Flavobacteriaceae bacterium S356]|uniref:Crp/Fnr family transcriptional regulator n=1 Tax=Asprobacillus argus TaxID=3076534 RepID=A0ABU3LI40_9FLAO|nr:Crp/Fnr family transcriptional regulator [Flavobacteriaceae bacterium S356]